MDFEKYFGRAVCKTLIISKDFVRFVNYLLKNRDNPAFRLPPAVPVRGSRNGIDVFHEPRTRAKLFA